MSRQDTIWLSGKFIVGFGGSYIAALFSPAGDDVLKEVAVMLGILVSFLTILNLMWSLVNKIHKKKDDE